MLALFFAGVGVLNAMNAKHVTPILNVSNIVESFAWFEKLGWKKGWDWGDPPTFGGVCSGKCEVTMPPTDEPWNVREMHVRHPDGHMFRLSQGLEEE